MQTKSDDNVETTKMGPNDASGVVWAVSKCFFFFKFLFVTNQLYFTTMIKQHHHVTMSSLHHSAPHPRFKRESMGKFSSFYLLQIGLEMQTCLEPQFYFIYLFLQEGRGLRQRRVVSSPKYVFLILFYILNKYFYYYISNPWVKPVTTHEPVSWVGVW